MAVTKQTYTATATWTASQLADIFKTAFIDAGYMTDWFDSFLSGSVENRVLRVIYDGSKTYGTVYYWFMFTTTTVALHTTLSWNAAGDAPSGTLYLQYAHTTTNATTSHTSLTTALVTTTDVSVVRYTSAVNSDCSWFVLRNGASTIVSFHVPSAGFGPAAGANLDQFAFNGIVRTNTFSWASLSAALSFVHCAGNTRLTYMGAAGFRGVTGNYNAEFTVNCYAVFGNVNNNGNNWGNGSQLGMVLPVAMANTTGLASNYTPVYTGFTAGAVHQAFPNDFGLVAYYPSNLPVSGDKFIVTAGVEEWDILRMSSNATADAGRIMLLARVV